MNRHLPLIVIFFVFAAGVLFLYQHSLPFHFTNYDDDLLILENPKIKHLSLINLQKLLIGLEEIAYQPVQDISFVLDYFFWGPEHPEGFRFTNLLLYFLNTLLFFLLAQKLLQKRALAFIATCLFLTHPTHVESVVWIAGRKDLLAGFFGLLTLLCWLQSSKQGLAFAFLFYLLALCSKPNMVILPFLGFLILRYKPQNGPKYKELCFAIGLTIPFLILFYLVATKNKVITEYHGGSAISTFYTMMAVYLDYFRIFFWPVDLSHYYEPIIYAKMELKVVFGLLTLLASIALFFWGWAKKNILGFVFGWFLFALFPYSNLVPISVLLADRYLYLASISLFIGLVYLLKNTKAVYGLLIVACLWGYQSYQQTFIWQDSIKLWENAQRHYPNSEKVLVSLGASYLQKASTVPETERLQWWEQSSKAFNKVLTQEAAPSNKLRAYFNLGVIACAKRNIGEAYEAFGLAEQELKSLLNSSLERWVQGIKVGDKLFIPNTKTKGTIQEIDLKKKTLILNKKEYRFDEVFPAPKELYHIQSNIYCSKGDLSIQANDLPMALKFYRRGVRLSQKSPQPRVTLASILSRTDQLVEAYQELDIALKLAPNFVPALSTKGILLMSEKLEDPGKAARRDQKAKKLFEQVLKLQPDHLEANFQLAMAVQPTDLQKFESQLKKVLKLAPNHREAHRFLLRYYLQRTQQEESYWDRLSNHVKFFQKFPLEDKDAQQELQQYYFFFAQFRLSKALALKTKLKKVDTEVKEKFDEAIKVYNTLIKLKPNSVQAYHGLLECLWGQEDYKNALFILHKLQRLAPQDYKILRHLGRTHMLRKEYLQAIYYFKKYRSRVRAEDVGGQYIDKNFIVSLQKKMEIEVGENYNQAKHLLGEKKNKAAKKLLENALLRNPEHPESNYLLARIAHSEENWHEEWKYLEKAVSLEKTVPPPQVYFELGIVCLRLEKPDRAEIAFEKFISLVPKAHSKVPFAEKHLKEAQLAKKEKMKVAFQKIQQGILLLKKGEKDAFFQDVQASLQLLPNTPELKLLLYQELVFQQQYYKAKQWLRSLDRKKYPELSVFGLTFLDREKFPVTYLLEALLLFESPTEKNILKSKFYLVKFQHNSKVAIYKEEMQAIMNDLRKRETRDIGKIGSQLKEIIIQCMPNLSK